MEYIAQIFTGGWHSPLYETRAIVDRLDRIRQVLKLKAVILGWTLDPELYRAVGRCLKGTGIQMFLWLPAFSEIGELGQADPAVNLFGTSGAYALQEGESFRFYCPSSDRNHSLLEQIYEDHFRDCGFDGVFLDKVRGQSFVTGPEDVFGCCCSRCRGLFREKGADPEAYLTRLKTLGTARALSVSALTPRGVQFSHRDTGDFFRAKGEICTDRVLSLVERFRRKGLLVGLDLYAPALCSLVGQDFDRLCEGADFVKPMMYRRTQAPAGVGFELDCFRQSVMENRETEKLLGSCPIESGDFLRQQLEALTPEQRAKTCPGLEINYREDIARTDPGYIAESLGIMESCGIHRAVLSWDMMLAPDSHLAAAGSLQISEKGV